MDPGPKYDRLSVENVTLSMVEGDQANLNPIITGSMSVQRSVKGLNLNFANETDLQLAKDTRVTMKKAGTNRPLAFVWPNLNDPAPSRSYHVAIDANTSSGDVSKLVDLLREYTYLVDEDESDNAAQNGLMLVDENGQILGSVDLQLDAASQSALDQKQFADADEPVILSPDANGQVHLTPLSALTAEYGQSTSKIVRGAEFLSRGVIWTSESLTSAMDRSVNKTVSSTAPTTSPLVFSNRTKSGFESLHSVTGKAANISARTLGTIAGYASTAGTSVGRKMGLSPDAPGASQTQSGFRGVLNNSIKGATTLFDSVDASSKHFLNRSQANSVAYTTHRYGNEAGGMMHNFTGSAKHCGLVFIDARGLGRTALLKGFGKGVVKAKMDNGQVVELKSDEFGALSPAASPKSSPRSTPPPPPLPQRDAKLQAEAAASGSASGSPAPRRTPSPLYRSSSATSSSGWNDPPAYHFKS